MLFSNLWLLSGFHIWPLWKYSPDNGSVDLARLQTFRLIDMLLFAPFALTTNRNNAPLEKWLRP